MAKTLAECLLRRKELQDKLTGIGNIRNADIYETKVVRRKAHEGIDDITASIPKLEFNQVAAEYNWVSSQFRRIDAYIQRTNWTTILDDVDELFVNYEDKVKK